VFLTGDPTGVPHALLHNLKHNQVLHARNLVVSVEILDTPFAESGERCAVQALGGGFHVVRLRFGFAEPEDVPAALAPLVLDGEAVDPRCTTFFLSRETIVATERPGMALWRDRLFAYLARNATPATAFFRIPPNRLVELGSQVEI